MKKLFLSYNNLVSLDGIENFPNLTHLSISYNKLCSVDELAKIGAKSEVHGSANHASKLTCLAVKGNYFLERHPDYKALIIRHFTGLKELDSLPVGSGSGGSNNLRMQMREGVHLKHSLMPFLLKLDKSLQMLTAHLNPTFGTHFDKIELVQRWSQIFTAKDYLVRVELTSPHRSSLQLKSNIK